MTTACSDIDVDVRDDFHPAVASWFHGAFDHATEAQQRAWPLIRSGRSTLVAAPTGSGKTLTAFLAAIDTLVREGIAHGGALPDTTTVVYVSPLKALSNDIRVNLQVPLEGIARELARMGLPDPGIRVAVRTGDTTQQERQAMRKHAPHILVTTPESLYVLLCSDSGRTMLTNVRTVIVDEIHAVAGSKRGSHLALSLERLDALCPRRPTRIGLSATQKPLEAVARFLVGGPNTSDCAIVDVGHIRARDLAIELPPVPLEAVMANDVWERVYDRMAELAGMHRTTLIFVNTRRMAERAARHLADRLGNEAVAAHHGSLAKEYRLDAEQRLKRGELRVLIATASLELGIDIGDVDLVCQVGSPRSIAAFLQRVGRSGHHVGGMPKGRLFPTSRDDLIECAALLDCVRRDELDLLRIPRAPLDVLAQQIVAEVACREWHEDALFDLVRHAEPYAGLERARYDAILRMLADGYTSRNGVRGAYLHRDTVEKTLRGRRGSKLTAVTSGGTIPDNADYTVLLEPQGHPIGTVNEDFAVESLAGDVFQLGNTSYRLLRIETGRVRVEDAHGAAPNIPFWLGEAPGRSDELSAGVARLRANIEERLVGKPLDGHVLNAAIDWLVDEVGIDDGAARQIVEYLARARAALGALPTQDTLAMERFFDESGGMQLVIHSPFGSRINRAWGLALRKRFCRTFNFELQAAATEDAIVLSLSTSHSFVLDEVWRYLRSSNAEHLLVQALLDAPLFNVRWRWNATTSLALPRYAGGRKVAPQIQRMKSDDLLAAVFPDQAACLENVVGEREWPSHPIVDQTVDDCLHEAMDSDGWLAVLRRIERGQLKLVARDLPAPSPLAMEILNARPYAYLDDAPLEERRTQAVINRRWTDPASADDLSALDLDAIASVSEEAWPRVRDADEMYEALMSLACVTLDEASAQEGWQDWLASLARRGRATRMTIRSSASAISGVGTGGIETGTGTQTPAPGAGAGPNAGAGTDAGAHSLSPSSNDGTLRTLWVPLERLACLQAAYGPADLAPVLEAPENDREPWNRDDAIVEIVRARLTGFGPQPLATIAGALGLPLGAVATALTKLETEGYVMRGRFTPDADSEQWCERHLLARIHRYTIKRLRREIEPVERQDFMRFLFDWQHLAPDARRRGRDALPEIVAQLEGFEAAASAWETDLLPARVSDYFEPWLDELCRAGKIVWSRIAAPVRAAGGPVRTTPIVLLPRRDLGLWNALPDFDGPPEMSARAERVHAALLRNGAMFFDELLSETRLLPIELEEAVGELVSTGLVNADSFAGLRALLLPAAKRAKLAKRRRRSASSPSGMDEAGRWSLVRRGNGNASVGVSGDASTSPMPAASGDIVATHSRRTPIVAGRKPRTDPEALEHIALVLLRRYGVVFWRLLEREAAWLPSWRELLPVFHRLEARGDIRGGRFVAGLAGEQFALPEAIPLLREVRRRPVDGALVCISGVDPLNLSGTLLPGEKVPALTGNRVLFRDGVPVATMIAGKPDYLVDLEAADREPMRAALTGRR
ncbi:DEAD/DEAH box helicase [Pararobbsia alpina]|uniref:ATP-dependent RNA helicase SrmB n=1 Tax=Pararobbsia alpina TaxID=621374 RepID=A0A6S7BF46_9BURK|nr:DEAD/DEAH box helicase [Pararobbsia alpina]CAB3798088.1 ATP-dependent RNA helicase SrmB [Pararobbsia alpina]